MKTVEIRVYQFEELGRDAQDKALDYFRANTEFPWFDEYRASAKAFIEHFDGSMLTWSFGDTRHAFIKTDLEPSNFRGIKLKSISRDHMPTGYCADSVLWEEFHDTFKNTSDAFFAYQQAIEAFLIYVQRDVEDFYSDQQMAEHISVNGYEFYEDGSFFYYDTRKVA